MNNITVVSPKVEARKERINNILTGIGVTLVLTILSIKFY